MSIAGLSSLVTLALTVLLILQHQSIMQANGACTTYYTVKSGDICYDIAQTYGIDVATLQSYNPGLQCDNLQIGQQLCVADDGQTPVPSPPTGNGKIFEEYIGAMWNGVKFSNVPVNDAIDTFNFILAFAIDYTQDGSASTNGQFSTFWDSSLTPDDVKAIKAQHSNVKVMVSLGGDTVNSQFVYFNPTSVDSWVSNAVSSLTTIIQQYGLDGIDIDYEHFQSTNEQFASAIGQLITQLKNNNVISVASIAPFPGVQEQYSALWSQYSNVIDYVNFQFYSYGEITASDYVTYYGQAVSAFPGGKVLASFSTSNAGTSTTPSTAISAAQQLQQNGNLAGIFIWCADNSLGNYQYEQQAQSILVAN